MATRARRSSPLGLASLVLLSPLPAIFLFACGGSTSSNGSVAECPPGYTCIPACYGSPCSTSSAGDAGSSPAPPWAPEPGDDAAAWSGPPSPGASDASASDYPEGSTPPSSATFQPLGYEVVDAKQSAALGSLVIAASSPTNALYFYDLATGADVPFGLPMTPVALAVDATGLFAAVAFDAHVAWVDLKAQTIKAMCPLSSDASDVALTTSGVAYVVPATDHWVPIHVIDLATCAETLASNVWAGARLALHPNQQVLFLTQDLDPESITQCDRTASPVSCVDAEGGADWGTYTFGNSVWVSADGTRLYSGGPATLVQGGDAGSVWTYGGSLPGVSAVQTLDEAPQVARVALVPSDSAWDPSSVNADTVVRVHETQYLGLVGQYALPSVPAAGGGSAPAHGRFVFAMSGMQGVYVIVQGDAEDGGGSGAYEVVTMVL